MTTFLQKIGEEIAGEEGGRVGAEAGTYFIRDVQQVIDVIFPGMRAGKKFGFRVGREAGIKVNVSKYNWGQDKYL